MAKLKWTFLSLVALTAATTSPAAPTHRMTGLKWEVVAGDGVCRLESNVDGGEFAVKAVAIGELPYSDVMSFGFQLRHEWSPDSTLHAFAKVGSEQIEQVAMIPRQLATDSPLYLQLDPANSTAVVHGAPLEVGFVSGERVKFDAAALPAGLLELKHCNSRLMSSRFGMAIDINQIRVRPQERIPMQDIYRDSDYPADALRNGQRGDVRFLGVVDVRGRLTKCVVLQSNKIASLDSATCQIAMRRARYKPARDTLGNAVNAPVEGRVAWRPSGIFIELPTKK